MPHFAITRKQREALFKVFQREFPSWVSPGKAKTPTRRFYGHDDGTGPCPTCGRPADIRKVPTWQWRTFRKKVMPTFFCDGSITVPYAGMWLCIETDGYTHS